ncbi:MAG: amino acid adenylation domain-containing protein, partial [Ardenticatenales bacterium]|nr:amino acid adenylation domain-containing protein [Ardenticatenales bacterium]
RYTGQSDIVVGTPTANRTRPELEGLLGFFVNMLALRTDLSGDPSFRTLLSRVREVASGAYAHQEMPFEKLVEALHPERDPSRSPFFQVLFAIQSDLSDGVAQVDGLSLKLLEKHNGSAKFDLTLFLTERPQGMEGAVEYNSDLFEPSSIERLVNHFQMLLRGVVSSPDHPISTLPLLSEPEVKQVLEAWNNTRTPYPTEHCVHELFEEQSARFPQKNALTSERESLTYKALNERANQLAHYLQQLGVGPEVPVALFMERSPEMVMATLAILKAGGYYVPLDPSYPEERLQWMLSDTRAPVLLTQQRFQSAVPAGAAQRVYLDLIEEPLAALPTEIPMSGTRPDNAAYVMYTSGSTGRPKGIIITHRNIIRLVRSTNFIELGPEDRVTHLSNSSFDASTFEIWGALLNGAELVVINRETLLSAQVFEDKIRAHAISTVLITTALFNQFAQERPSLFETVGTVMFGGEAADPHALRRILHARPPQRLLNVYGPTESTTFSSTHHVREVPEKTTTIPIGHPIANTTQYVLDSFLQPVPIGVSGELYIGGDGLARGYLHRPELTAERFVPDPFSHEPGARLYRTGDLGRYRADGAIEYLGRLDHQVKIRGFRIELGEIEARLGQHPSAQEVIVLAREDGTTGKRLVAYVVPAPLTPLTGQELRLFLQAQLPAYMVPSAFV